MSAISVRLNCRKWELSVLPCGHVCAVCREEALTNCNQWALPWFTKTYLKGTYNEMVFPLADEADWVTPNNLQKVLPPVMDKNKREDQKTKIVSDQKMKSQKKISVAGVATTATHVKLVCNHCQG